MAETARGARRVRLHEDLHNIIDTGCRMQAETEIMKDRVHHDKNPKLLAFSVFWNEQVNGKVI